MVDLAAIEGLVAEAIPGEQATGINARYEETYEQLAEELAKLDSLSDDQPEWHTVADLACTVLKDLSKDMMVGAWLSGALWETEGYAGLRSGLAGLRILLRDYWDEGFPGRLRARRSAVAWICDRALTWSELAEPVPTREDLVDLVDIVGDLYTCTEDKWDGEDPPIWQLQKRYKAMLDDVPAPAADPAPVMMDDDMPAPSGVGGVSDDMPAPAGAFAAGGANAVAVGAIGTRAEAFHALKQVALFLEKTEPHSPVVPLLRRAVEWGDLSFEELYGKLLGRFPTGMAYMWDTLGISLDEVEGGVESLPPESRGGIEVSLGSPGVGAAPKLAPVAAIIEEAMPTPASVAPTRVAAKPAVDDGDDMPPPTIL